MPILFFARRLIAFASKRHGQWDIFVIPAKAAKLGVSLGIRMKSIWLEPDGQHIAFGARRDSPAIPS